MSPLEQFLVHKLYTVSILGYSLPILNATLPMLISSATLGCLLCVKSNIFTLRLHEFLRKLIYDTAGSIGLRYINLLYMVFFFVLMGNLLGMIPVLYTYTSSPLLVLTFAASIITLVACIGILEQGRGFFTHFYPKDIAFPIASLICLIEIVSFLIRPITLCARLCINMIAGHIMLKIFAGFIAQSLLTAPIVLPVLVAMNVFELAVAVLQAYIFTLLVCLYIKEATHH